MTREPGRRWWRRKREPDLWGGAVIVGPVKYEFEAVIARLGVPDRSNQVLVPPKKTEQRQWAAALPLPLLPLRGRYVRVGRTLPEGPIGKIERIEMDDNVVGGAITAWGSLYDTEPARDHAGALTLQTAWMKCEFQAVRQEGGADRPEGLRMHHWRVMGASIVDQPVWDTMPVKIWPVAEA